MPINAEMTDVEELVELLRSTARFKYGMTKAADLMLEAADMIELLAQRLEFAKSEASDADRHSG